MFKFQEKILVLVWVGGVFSSKARFQAAGIFDIYFLASAPPEIAPRAPVRGGESRAPALHKKLFANYIFILTKMGFFQDIAYSLLLRFELFLWILLFVKLQSCLQGFLAFHPVSRRCLQEYLQEHFHPEGVLVVGEIRT